jgi:two-component system, NarL family, vancomycin resistance associated response regulator VraR
MLSCKRPVLRVLVVDDHELTRFSLKLALQKQAGFELVGMASNGCEAVEMTRTHAPDIVIIDIQMPVMDGLTASTQIKAAQPHVQILVYSSLEESQSDGMLQAARVDAFCLKETTTNDLLQVVNRLGQRILQSRDSSDWIDATLAS